MGDDFVLFKPLPGEIYEYVGYGKWPRDIDPALFVTPEIKWFLERGEKLLVLEASKNQHSSRTGEEFTIKFIAFGSGNIGWIFFNELRMLSFQGE